MSKVKVLFIRNLTMNTSEDEISKAFGKVSDGQIERVKKAKDYAFVHFNTREAAEKAYEATKDDFILNKCPVEVTWSKPINRLTHFQKKQLFKEFKAFNPSKPFSAQMAEQRGMKPPFPVAVNSNFLPQPLIPEAPATSPGINKQHAIGKSMTALRPRSAAGIRGLESQGTGISPILASNGFNNYNMIEPGFAKMTHDFASLSLDDTAYNGLIPPLGGPTSPPSNGAGHSFFGAGSGNLSMNAPSTLSALSPPFYYYGSI